MTTHIFFSGCRALINKNSHRDALDISRCILISLMCSQNLPEDFQVNVLFSFLMLHNKNGFNQCLKTLFAVPKAQKIFLKSDIIGRALIEVCQRCQKNLPQLFLSLLPHYHLTQAELMVKSILISLPESSLKLFSTEDFNQSLSIFLLKMNHRDENFCQLFEEILNQPYGIFYLRLLIHGLPSLSTQKTFLPFIIKLINTFSQKLLETEVGFSLYRFHLLFAYAIILEKITNPQQALSLFHLASPIPEWINYFSRYFEKLTEEYYLIHAYCLVLEASRSFIKIMCDNHKTAIAIELSSLLFFNDKFTDLCFSHFSEKDQDHLLLYLNSIFDSFSDVEIHDFLNRISTKTFGICLSQALLKPLFHRICFEKPTTLNNFFYFLQNFWESLDEKANYKYDLLKTLLELHIIKLDDQKALKKIDGLIHFSIQTLKKQLSCHDNEKTIWVHQKTLASFLLFIKNSLIEPQLQIQFKEHYTLLYRDLLLKCPQQVYNGLIDFKTKYSLSRFFFEKNYFFSKNFSHQDTEIITTHHAAVLH